MITNTERIARKYKQLNDLQAALELANTVNTMLRENRAGRWLIPVQHALAYSIEGLRIQARRLREEAQKLEGVNDGRS